MTAQITVKGIVAMDPEVKEFGDNKKVRFTVASGGMKKGEKFTDWYTIEAWNGNIDLVLERIQKGQLVEVTGKFRSSLYFSEKHKVHKIDNHISLANFRILPKSLNETVVEELSA